MALEMRTVCERCDRPIGMLDEALICSYECTWCPDCVATFEGGACPNCAGDLVRRPTRS